MCFKNCNVLFCKGNQTCSRCHKLEKELGALKGEMEQIKLKHNEERTLITEKSRKIAKLRETNGRHDPVQEYGLEQVIEKEREEKRKIESRLLSEKSAVEKKLQKLKVNIVNVKRKNERLQGEINAHLNTIKKLENPNKELVTKNKNHSSKFKTECHTRESDELTAEVNRLPTELNQLRMENKNLKMENEDYLQKISKLDEKNKTLETENNNHLSKIKTETTECNKLKAERSALYLEQGRLVKANEESLQRIKDLETDKLQKIEDLEEKIKTLEKKNDRYRKY